MQDDSSVMSRKKRVFHLDDGLDVVAGNDRVLPYRSEPNHPRKHSESGLLQTGCSDCSGKRRKVKIDRT